jgi:hypothetical protein
VPRPPLGVAEIFRAHGPACAAPTPATSASFVKRMRTSWPKRCSRSREPFNPYVALSAFRSGGASAAEKSMSVGSSPMIKTDCGIADL